MVSRPCDCLSLNVSISMLTLFSLRSGPDVDLMYTQNNTEQDPDHIAQISIAATTFHAHHF